MLGFGVTSWIFTSILPTFQWKPPHTSTRRSESQTCGVERHPVYASMSNFDQACTRSLNSRLPMLLFLDHAAGHGGYHSQMGWEMRMVFIYELYIP